MKKPPMVNPTIKKLKKLTCPKYSGSKNSNGTPYETPNNCKTDKNKISQKNNTKICLLICNINSCSGKL